MNRVWIYLFSALCAFTSGEFLLPGSTFQPCGTSAAFPVVFFFSFIKFIFNLKNDDYFANVRYVMLKICLRVLQVREDSSFF